MIKRFRTLIALSLIFAASVTQAALIKMTDTFIDVVVATRLEESATSYRGQPDELTTFVVREVAAGSDYTLTATLNSEVTTQTINVDARAYSTATSDQDSAMQAFS